MLFPILNWESALPAEGVWVLSVQQAIGGTEVPAFGFPHGMKVALQAMSNALSALEVNSL